MSVESIAARVAAIDARIAAIGGQGSQAAGASFAQTLTSATAASSPVPAAATVTATGAAVPYATEIDAAGRANGIDPSLLRGLIRQESNFNPDATSSAGAKGLTQLMPATAAALGVDPTDPVQAIEGGARYLRQQLDRFGGDVSKALAAYNAGPGAVAKHGGVPPYAETQTYVQKVLGYAQAYGEAALAAPVSAVPVTTTPVAATTASTSGLAYSTV